MRRPLVVWVVFALCAVVGLSVLGWFTVERVRLERDAAEARSIALVESRVRLALWRIDSALATIHGAEEARAVSDYEPFSVPARVFGAGLQSLENITVRLPSPLLAERPPFVRLHLQVFADGRIISPQAPEGRDLEVALQSGLPEEVWREASTLVRSEALKALAPPLLTLASTRSKDADYDRLAAAQASADSMLELENAGAKSKVQQQLRDESVLNSAERQQRVELAESNYLARSRSNLSPPPAAVAPARASSVSEHAPQQFAGVSPKKESAADAATQAVAAVEAAAFTAHWIDGKLFLVRAVEGTLPLRVQAVWLDWEALRPWLLGRIVDLLPEARLEPESGSGDPAQAMRQLALLPVELRPGALPEIHFDAHSATTGLGLAWALALLGVGALALLLAGTLRLSERRAAFVSAVTHELRTPLTTFRLYSEMLAGGMVTDSERRQSYLLTLQREAGRLSHLVENVLSYARLERGSARSRVEETTAGALVNRIVERLRERAAQAGMEVAFEFVGDAAECAVCTDAAAFEQVIFNLVDNAAKYAKRPDRHGCITVSAERTSKGGLCVRVRDEGPGLSPMARKRLFRPFSKSAVDAANSQPGVGLGLSLSRRLAREELGGDLKLEHTGPDGTCFLLEMRSLRAR